MRKALLLTSISEHEKGQHHVRQSPSSSAQHKHNNNGFPAPSYQRSGGVGNAGGVAGLWQLFMNQRRRGGGGWSNRLCTQLASFFRECWLGGVVSRKPGDSMAAQRCRSLAPSAFFGPRVLETSDDPVNSYRIWRASIYRILEHPTGYVLLFNIAIFVFVVVLLCLSAFQALEKAENAGARQMVMHMELAMAMYLTVEFGIRMWALDADAKYVGWKGRLRYMIRPICITDMIVLIVSYVLLLVDHGFATLQTVDYFRFVHGLRLLHFDRQMSTWKMVFNMIHKNKYELFTAYYITFISFLLLSASIYGVECAYELYDEHAAKLAGQNLTADATFATYGDALWFSVITILTVGYGDIVPKRLLSKILVGLLSFTAICLFQASSTLVGVGMTMTMEKENKRKHKSFLRHIAARVIQSWFRYHLLTKKFYEINHFRKLSQRVFLAEQRIMNARRSIAEELKIRKTMTQKFTSILQRGNSTAQITPSGSTIDLLPPEGGSRASKLWSTIIQVIQSNTTLIGPADIDIESTETTPARKTHSAGILRRTSTESASAEVQFSPFGEHRKMNFLARQQSPKHDEENDSDSVVFTQFTMDDLANYDETAQPRHRIQLRLIYLLLFSSQIKRFKRARQPYEIIDAEEELSEMEHQRSQKFKELSAQVELLVGGQKAPPPDSVLHRLEECEKKLEEMQLKAVTIEQLVEKIADKLNMPVATSSTNSDVPPLRPHVAQFIRRQFKQPKRRLLSRQHNLEHHLPVRAVREL